MSVMKITKYVHSCLLIEDHGVAILIDPGGYSTGSGLLNVNELPKLDSVLITHEHPDHMDADFLKLLQERLPELLVAGSQSAVGKLEDEGVKVSTDLPEGTTAEDASHQPLPWRTPVPDNRAFTVFDKLTHPGDSLEITKTASVLALPLQAPWGSTKEALDMALRLQPEKIIPVHDWHWRDEARTSMYAKAEKFLKGYGIKFLPVENGRSVEV